jgi:hypothetical protein
MTITTRVMYDENGDCTRCGMPASGFVNDGVCHCLDNDWSRDDEDALEEWDISRRRRDRL